jgi:hypothetical protein
MPPRFEEPSQQTVDSIDPNVIDERVPTQIGTINGAPKVGSDSNALAMIHLNDDLEICHQIPFFSLARNLVCAQFPRVNVRNMSAEIVESMPGIETFSRQSRHCPLPPKLADLMKVEEYGPKSDAAR